MLRRQEVTSALALVMTVGGCSPPVPTPATIEIQAEPAPPVIASAAPPHASATGARSGAPPIAWEASEAVARDRARRGRRPLVVWVRADWSAAALEMERRTWPDPKVAEAARGFVALRLDVTSTDDDAELYAGRYKIDVVPMTIVFDPRGDRIVSLRGYAEAAAVVAALGKATE